MEICFDDTLPLPADVERIFHKHAGDDLTARAWLEERGIDPAPIIERAGKIALLDYAFVWNPQAGRYDFKVYPADLPLRLIEPRDWEGKPVPEQPWFVEGWIPMQTVTLLSGDGGSGKTEIVLQLMASACLRTPQSAKRVQVLVRCIQSRCGHAFRFSY